MFWCLSGKIWLIIGLQRFLFPFCLHQGKVPALSYLYTFFLLNKNDFRYNPHGNSSRSPSCVCREGCSVIPSLSCSEFPPIHLSLHDGWKRKFPTQATWVAPQPVCHYCWPVAHLYLPLISWPPREAANTNLREEGAKGEAREWDRMRGR